MKRFTPLVRTGFKRNTPVALNPHSGAALRRTPMKRSRRRSRPATGIDGKYLAACQGEPCYLRVPGVCCGDWRTVVPCHSNELAHGKGKGITAEHQYTVPGCVTCHSWLDQGAASKADKFAAFRAAHEEWVPWRTAKLGLLAGDVNG